MGLLLFSSTCIVGFFDLFLVFLDLIEIRFGCKIFFEIDLVAGFQFGACHILVWVLGLFLRFGKNIKNKFLFSY